MVAVKIYGSDDERGNSITVTLTYTASESVVKAPRYTVKGTIGQFHRALTWLTVFTGLTIAGKVFVRDVFPYCRKSGLAIEVVPSTIWKY